MATDPDLRHPDFIADPHAVYWSSATKSSAGCGRIGL